MTVSGRMLSAVAVEDSAHHIRLNHLNIADVIGRAIVPADRMGDWVN